MRWGHLCLCAALLTPAARAAGGDPPRYFVETIAGNASAGDGGLAVAAQLGAIQGLAMDRLGNLYLSDTDNHRVRKVDTRGVITTVAGTGVAGLSGDGGPAAEARLNLPYGLAVDASGALYIADLGNKRVRRVTSDGVISTFAGGRDDLLAPRNLAVDGGGNLYISEFEGHRVRRVSPGGAVTTVAGTGAAGFAGDGGPASRALLKYPAGLALDAAGNLYVADSGNQRVRRIRPDGGISTVLGGPGATPLLTPTAVAVDASGTIYVADSAPVVRAWTPSGTWGNYAGTGLEGYSGDGGLARGAMLTAPRELVAGPGALWIADGVRVRAVDLGGIISTVAGDGYARFVGDGGPASTAPLSRPLAVALNPAGDLFVADPGAQRVRLLTALGTAVTLAGTGAAGIGAEPAPASSAPLKSPMGVAVAASGAVLIADSYNHRIRQVDAAGLIRTVAGTGSSGTGPEGGAPLFTALRGPARGVRGYGGDRLHRRYLQPSPPALQAGRAARHGRRHGRGRRGGGWRRGPLGPAQSAGRLRPGSLGQSLYCRYPEPPRPEGGGQRRNRHRGRDGRGWIRRRRRCGRVRAAQRAVGRGGGGRREPLHRGHR